jgi:hypothetical protein
LEEEPDNINNMSQRIMNMDDRDKAGDPDSNPEIDDDDSMESSKLIHIKTARPKE